MGPFPLYNSNVYILVCVDYVTKWVEVIAYVANEAQIIAKFLKKTVSISRKDWSKNLNDAHELIEQHSKLILDYHHIC